MNTLNVINARRSYRGAYQQTPVPREDLVKILEAGLAAPSGCNKQTTSLIAVDDPEVLANLYEALSTADENAAPAMICVLTQRIIAIRDCCFAVQDYSAAIQNMLLAMVDLGYQSCWFEGRVTDPNQIGKKMSEILGVPEGYELVCYLPVGIAAEEVLPNNRKKPFEERAWFNTFGGNA